jgi:HNH endonuclease
MILTAERLREVLDYNPETGVFTWKMSHGNGVKAGNVAGRNAGRGYRQISVDKKLYGEHRLAFLFMTGEFPPQFVDHIDCDPSNNRWRNLRSATLSQNGANRRLNTNNKVGLKGVKFNRGKFVATIKKDGKMTHLGRFATADAAHKAYNNAATETFGQFARVA